MKVMDGYLMKAASLKATLKGKLTPMLLFATLLAFVLFFAFFITRPIATTANVEHVAADEIELPDGYKHFGPSRWVSESQWTGLVLDIHGISGIAGDSKECRIYEMTISEVGYGEVYSINPVFDMDGSPATMLFDGKNYG